MSLSRRWKLLAALALLAGCGGEGQPRTAPVKGKVTLDDRPLAAGEIKFTVEGGGGVPTILPIAGGSYEGPAPVGKNRVEIYSFRKTAVAPRNVPGAEEPSQENIIPARYNSESALAADVTSDGPNVFNYEVRARP